MWVQQFCTITVWCVCGVRQFVSFSPPPHPTSARPTPAHTHTPLHPATRPHDAQVTKPQLLEVGEGEFLEWCGLVVSREVWRKKEIRANTRHVYQQHK